MKIIAFHVLDMGHSIWIAFETCLKPLTNKRNVLEKDV